MLWHFPFFSQELFRESWSIESYSSHDCDGFKKVFDDGYYVNAAGDAFIEINDRVKKIFKNINPLATKVPDGDTAMTTVFSFNNPLLKVCDISTDSGQNEQKDLC